MGIAADARADHYDASGMDTSSSAFDPAQVTWSAGQPRTGGVSLCAGMVGELLTELFVST
jgi:hypothetical protein